MAEKSALEVLKLSIEALKEQIKPLMKDDTDKFIQIACNYIEANQKVMDATRPSLFAAILKAAQCSLFIDGQESSIVSFNQTATLMTGYKGILKMVRNSGELASINAGVVYEKDKFDYYVDEKGEHLEHRPTFSKDRGLPIVTYCIARTKGNKEPYIEVMPEEEVEACKKSSVAFKKGYDTPWKGPFADEMRKKTVIRRIGKRLPMSTDLNVAIHSDDALFTTHDDSPAATDTTDAAPAPQSSRLEQALGAQTTAPATAKPETVSQEQEKQKVDDVKKTFSGKVEGIIAHISGKTFPATADKPERTRYSCKVGEIFYGTWDKAIFLKVEELYNKKAESVLTFVTLLNSKKQPYNDILDVVEKVSEEPVPI